MSTAAKKGAKFSLRWTPTVRTPLDKALPDNFFLGRAGVANDREGPSDPCRPTPSSLIT